MSVRRTCYDCRDEEEEIEEEFDDALVEIAGVKSFPCEQCDEVSF